MLKQVFYIGGKINQAANSLGLRVLVIAQDTDVS